MRCMSRGRWAAVKCSGCGHENQPVAGSCRQCDRPLTITCPRCGATLEAQAHICSQCDTPVLAVGQPGAAAPAAGELSRLVPQPPVEPPPLSSTPTQGERKLVTILFSDIVDSTRIAAGLDPEEWKEVVSGAHRRVSQSVVRYGGTIAQLLGDGVLAFFGAPLTHEDDPLRAVRAALEIQASIESYRQDLKGLVDDFQMRIGLHTGQVVVGLVGDEAHREYLALGDPVNLAARLQSAAQPGRVLLSQATAGLVESFFDLDPVGPLTLKGKDSPVAAFQVAGFKPTPESPRGLPGVRTPLVGRDQELASLRSALSALRLGQGQVVALIGEAGIGKTRLMQEARALASAPSPGGDPTPPTRWLEGRALSYGESLSFWTITQLLLSDLGLSDGEPEVRISVALKRRIRSLFGDQRQDVEPYLLSLMGLPLEGVAADSLRRLDGEARKHQTILALASYLEKAALSNPTVLLLEDVHWLDPSSLEAIEALLPITDRAPLMIALLMRPERQHGSWRLKIKMESDYSHRLIEISLRPLGPGQSKQLAAELLATRQLDDRLRSTLLDRAGGNPFYLEELIRDLMERGLILRGPDAVQLAEADLNSTIPTTLQGVLSGRIDRLPEADRRVLQLASVIGQTFLLRILQAICDDPSLLEPSLASLQRAEFLHQVGGLPEREYAFRHSLTQQAAYQSLLLEQRRTIHLKVGQALEFLFPERRQEFLGLLAHHFELAGAGDRAVGYLLEAGDRARLGEELPEAAGYYRRALPFLMEAEDWARASHTWLKLGLVYHADFDFKSAHVANETAFALAGRRTQDRPPRAHPDEGSLTAANQNTLRIALHMPPVSLDPGIADDNVEVGIATQIFAGLTELDSETNILPHIARSWEVLDEGRRYLFHLRNDARWTDGSPVTAYDFEWAWKRNLSPATGAFLAYLLDPISGAQDFRKGLCPDPESVGIRALDAATLEVQLEAPTAYFIYLTAHPIAYPLPGWQISRVGESWWGPETIISNGPFRLGSLNVGEIGLIRNHGYFADSGSCIDSVQYRLDDEEDARLRQYLEGSVDVAYCFQEDKIPDEIRPELESSALQLGLTMLLVLRTRRPWNDCKVRKALAHALDRRTLLKRAGADICAPAYGGVIPLGLAGHSPGIALPHNPDLARSLLAEAGFPGGSGCPQVTLGYYQGYQRRSALEEIINQWRGTLGIEAALKEIPRDAKYNEEVAFHQIDLLHTGWFADYPDPHSFLFPADIHDRLRRSGWDDSSYDEIARSAPHIANRTQRMSMYRRADSLLVAEQALVIPLEYGGPASQLVKSWVRNYRTNSMSWTTLRQVTIDPHPG
jgi:ABC-type oligopeptide transport system substrate-binding subunit/class 3 adenylate cyclase